MITLWASILLTASSATDADSGWARFRGPDGSGHIEGPMPPLEWSSSNNLRWRVPLPGKGSSSPVLTEEYAFVTAYTGYGLDPENPGNLEELKLHVLAFDRVSGEEMWRFTVDGTGKEDPYTGFITQHGYASSTPATDGDRVYALLGKAGLFALDLDGALLWQKSLGEKSDPARWGDGSSPVVVGDQVVIDAGVLGNWLIALDKMTGETSWSLSDPSYTNCWSTPITRQVGDSTQILFGVPSKIIAVDAASGEQQWECKTPLADAVCGGIVCQDGVAYLMGSRAGRGIAVQCANEQGANPKVLWQNNLRSGISTPVIVDEQIYWASGGVFYAAALSNGEYAYRERLPRHGEPTGGFPNADYSSPIAIDDLIFQWTRNGESYVIRAGEEFELVAHNPAFEGDSGGFSATPATADSEIYVRSDNYLYCIGETETDGAAK